MTKGGKAKAKPKGKTKGKREVKGKDNQELMELGSHLAKEPPPLTLCLFVEHGFSEMSHSIYLIQPDLSPVQSYQIDSYGFFVDNHISPLFTFEVAPFLLDPAMFKMGSLIYFFGGYNYRSLVGSLSFLVRNGVSNEFKLAVRVLDTNHPELGLLSVASMNVPKQTPCVFEADGMMYALGSAWSLGGKEIMMNHDPNPRTGCFERYDPKSDKWEILADPPLPLVVRRHNKWSGQVTVVDRHVFIGDPFYLAIFNLDTQEWVPLPPELPANRFHYGSIFYDSHLYYLRGHHGPETDHYDPEKDFPLEFVKRGPLHIHDKNNPSTLLSQECLSLGNAQVLATAAQLDGCDALYTRAGFKPWRKCFHLGDHVFCYVVTAHLVEDFDGGTVYEPQCRGLWIKFFKEVRADQNDKTEFRLLGSFCYKSSTAFYNSNLSVGCCVFGSVPEEWVKGVPLTQTLEKQKKSHHELERDNVKFEDEVFHLQEELNRLKSEIEVKDKLLKTMLAERPPPEIQVIKT